MAVFGTEPPGSYFVVFINNEDDMRIGSQKDIPIPRVGEDVILVSGPLQTVKRVVHETCRRPLRVLVYVEEAK